MGSEIRWVGGCEMRASGVAAEVGGVTKVFTNCHWGRYWGYVDKEMRN